MSFVASCVRLLLRPLPSTGVTRLPRYFEPLRHPIRPGLSLASCPLIPTAITAGGSRVASGLLCVHAIAIIPAGSMELVRSSVSIDCGLPCEKVRSAPAIVFSGPAQRSLMLWPARSRSRQATLSIESSGSFVASAAVSIATGWSEPVPGRELHPLKSSAFSRRTFTPTTQDLFGQACTCVGRQRVFLRTDDQQPKHDGEFGQERWLKRAKQDVVIHGREEAGHGKHNPADAVEQQPVPEPAWQEPRARD